MKKLIITGLITLLSAFSAWSAVIVDVFGVDQQTAQDIKQKYAADIQKVEGAIAKNIHKNVAEDTANNEKSLELKQQQKKLTEDIKKQYDLAFVDLQTVHYPNQKDVYTTVEVITKNDKARLKYVDNNAFKNYPQRNDIIQKMIEFEAISTDIAMHNEKPEFNCPVNHCISSFEHPELKPYLEMFNTAAKKDKKLIINTLKTDPNPERRGAAVFLVAHLKNPNEVLKILLPQINNSSILVRNNSMRVIGMTIEKNKLTKVNAEPFIKQLDSPYLTDRNKALYVLFNLAKQEKAKKQMLASGKKRLIKILRLTQPNNHQFAYLILKSISGKDFDEKDYKGWEEWAKESSSAKKLSKT